VGSDAERVVGGDDGGGGLRLRLRLHLRLLRDHGDGGEVHGGALIEQPRDLHVSLQKLRIELLQTKRVQVVEVSLAEELSELESGLGDSVRCVSEQRGFTDGIARQSVEHGVLRIDRALGDKVPVELVLLGLEEGSTLLLLYRRWRDAEPLLRLVMMVEVVVRRQPSIASRWLRWQVEGFHVLQMFVVVDVVRAAIITQSLSQLTLEVVVRVGALAASAGPPADAHLEHAPAVDVTCVDTCPVELLREHFGRVVEVSAGAELADRVHRGRALLAPLGGSRFHADLLAPARLAHGSSTSSDDVIRLRPRKNITVHQEVSIAQYDVVPTRLSADFDQRPPAIVTGTQALEDLEIDQVFDVNHQGDRFLESRLDRVDGKAIAR